MTPDEILHDKLESIVPDLQLEVPAEKLIKRGRRMRAARQSLVAAGAAAAVAGVTVGGVALSGHHTTDTSTASGNVAQANPPADPACGVAPQSTAGAPPASGDGSAATPWGAPMEGPSGVAGTEVVVNAFHVSGMQCTNVGFEFAAKDLGTGTETPFEETNEFDGSDIAPGFHGTGLTTVGDGWYVVGYYVGPAATISIPADGQPAAAHIASWAVNPDVKVWWVHGSGATPALGTPSAADAAGAPLPGGDRNGQPGVG